MSKNILNELMEENKKMKSVIEDYERLKEDNDLLVKLCNALDNIIDEHERKLNKIEVCLMRLLQSDYFLCHGCYDYDDMSKVIDELIKIMLLDKYVVK